MYVHHHNSNDTPTSTARVTLGLMRLVGMFYLVFSIIPDLSIFVVFQHVHPFIEMSIPPLIVIILIVTGIIILWHDRHTLRDAQAQADDQGGLTVQQGQLYRHAGRWILGLALTNVFIGWYVIVLLGEKIGIESLLFAGIIGFFGLGFLGQGIFGKQETRLPPTTESLANRVATLEAEIQRMKSHGE